MIRILPANPQYMVEGKKIYSKCCPGYRILGIVIALFS